jgi:hypothetical protein
MLQHGYAHARLLFQQGVSGGDTGEAAAHDGHIHGGIAPEGRTRFIRAVFRQPE